MFGIISNGTTLRKHLFLYIGNTLEVATPQNYLKEVQKVHLADLLAQVRAWC